MSTAAWSRVRTLFGDALDQPPADRVAWLREAAAGEPGVVDEVMRLLSAHETAGSFLEAPAMVTADEIAGAAPLMDALAAGSQLGAYIIVRELGRGGMGVVYLARDTRLERDVALKVLPSEAAADPTHRTRLLREARAAATISHPSVATVYTLEYVDDRLYLVSEYVRGRTLRDVLSAGPFTVDRACRIAARVADALDAAHAAGVIHRDLKPENVLLTDDDAVKVVDFGIAWVEGLERTRLTQQGDLVGTPAYMAPEQLAGATADARTDVYGAGLLLAEMLAGRHPLSDGGAPALPPPIAAIVARCLQPNPGGRYASAAAFRDALAALDAPSPVVGGPASWPDAPWWWRFHQAIATVSYTLLLVPAWLARRTLALPDASTLAPYGRWLLAATLAAAVAAITMRLHLLFVSRRGMTRVAHQLPHSARWLRAADLAFAAGIFVGGVAVEDARGGLGVLLMIAGVAAALAATVIEPATTRAALDDHRH